MQKLSTKSTGRVPIMASSLSYILTEVIYTLFVKVALKVPLEIRMAMLSIISLGIWMSWTNEAEVFAFLIGSRSCRDRVDIRLFLKVIPFFFFCSAIQWGSGKSSYPWRLVDWMEEVQDISHQDAQLHHILREANVTTDSLAKEGVLHTFLSFGV